MILCPKCGSKIADQAVNCPFCSYALAPMPPGGDIAMILCPECGSEIDEQAVTCPFCSYALAKMAQGGEKILCPECGSEIDDQTVTCPLCSYALAKMARKESRAASQPPPADYRHYTHYASYHHQKMKSQELFKFSMIFCGFLGTSRYYHA